MNRRLVPDVYVEVVPITGSPTVHEMEGPGAPFEFAVKMRLFSEEQEIHHNLADEEIAIQLFRFCLPIRYCTARNKWQERASAFVGNSISVK